MSTSQGNPTDPNWLEGPPAVGGRAFVMPLPNGQNWTYTPGDMTDLTKLGYAYDDTTPPATTSLLAQRLQSLSAPPSPSS